MKIAIISEYNIFSTLGGTEYYVNMLICGLRDVGHEIYFITKGKHAPAEKDEIITEINDGVKISYLADRRYSQDAVEQKEPSVTLPVILDLLKDFAPDIIHAHTMTPFFNKYHFEACAKIFHTIFFTSHIPGNFCPKGDLILFDKMPCDGRIYLRCSLCLFSKSIKSGFSNLLLQHYKKPLKVIASLEKNNIRVIFPSHWQKEQFERNGFPGNKIAVIRQALLTGNKEPENNNLIANRKRLGYLGRLAPEKGSVLLFKVLEHFCTDPDFNFVLAIPANSDANDIETLRRIVETAEGRIKVMHGIGPENKQDFFDKIDELLIPSFFIETGPIVLLEAVYYNKFVLAPDIGGTAEFALEFPEVHLYKWNDSGSLIAMIKKRTASDVTTTEQHAAIFKKKQTEFIARHIGLYEDQYAKGNVQ